MQESYLLGRRELYYTVEHFLIKFFELVSGVPVKTKNLRRVKIVSFGSRRKEYQNFLKEKIEKELSLEVEIGGFGEVPSRVIEWKTHIFVPYAVRHLLKIFPRRKGEAILGITPYQLSLLPPLWPLRQFYRFHFILGIALPHRGIALVTTLKDKIAPSTLAKTSLHEIAHLLGIHGYPLWR
jgi:hypothetical protein